jgi:hypothetical protein
MERMKDIDASDGLDTEDHDLVLRVLREVAAPRPSEAPAPEEGKTR